MDLSDKGGNQVTVSLESFSEHYYLEELIRPNIGWLDKAKLVLAASIPEYPNRFSAVNIPNEALPDVLQRIDKRIEELGDLVANKVGPGYEVSVLMEAAHKIVEYRSWL